MHADRHTHDTCWKKDKTAHYAVLPFFLCLYYMVCPPSEDDWTAFSKKCLHSLPSGVWATPDFPGRGGPDSDWCIKVRQWHRLLTVLLQPHVYIPTSSHGLVDNICKSTTASPKHPLCMLQFIPNKLPFDFLTVPAHSGPRQKTSLPWQFSMDTLNIVLSLQPQTQDMKYM